VFICAIRGTFLSFTTNNIPQESGFIEQPNFAILFCKFKTMNNYERIQKAIEYITANFQQQPNLDEVAKQVHMSPFHFQRIFKEWAGVSPKKFLQYISVEHAKSLLQQNYSISDVSFETGLSGTSRLHDLFVTIEGMTPGEYKNGGEQLHINYSFAESPFGNILVASTAKGICHLAFAEDEADAFQQLKNRFPKATFKQVVDAIQQNALFIFTQDWKDLSKIKLHLKGTGFQLKVWEALLKVPMGNVTTYSTVAAAVGKANASRAVGTAVGDNPVAFLIPCHRVIKSTGMFGQYHWGSVRKTAMLGWEAAKVFSEN
jgi:AraC family transcriptional regulator of adaptative response/methylated-DNA-[protein]-cysteine methyltransferase